MAVFICLLFLYLSWVVLWCSKFDTAHACVCSTVHTIADVLITVYKQIHTHTTRRRGPLDDLSVVVMRGLARVRGGGGGTSGAFPSGGKVNISNKNVIFGSKNILKY